MSRYKGEDTLLGIMIVLAIGCFILGFVCATVVFPVQRCAAYTKNGEKGRICISENPDTQADEVTYYPPGETP